MKISFLTPDFSHNCVARAWLLAELLKGQHQVEIVGPVLGKGIWPPFSEEKGISKRLVVFNAETRMRHVPGLIAKEIDGDVVYVSKPLFHSYIPALYKKMISGRPVILDIDDWEMGFNYNKGITDWQDYLCEKLKFLANGVTVSNSFLQNKFGGEIIWHARDTDALDPGKFDGSAERLKRGFSPADKIVMFCGTPRRHKGIEDLMQAFSLLKDSDAKLAVVGMDSSVYCQGLAQKAEALLGNKFVGFGLQPFSTVPEFLAMADVVVIPQIKTPASVGQMPAKVFDAMAMGKPVIVTRVSDLAEVVGHAGVVVEQNQPAQLAEAIHSLIERPNDARELGRLARERCCERYSYKTMGEKLSRIVEKFD
jgi:glycosyltransferase involved in cell wall biosynthesis